MKNTPWVFQEENTPWVFQREKYPLSILEYPLGFFRMYPLGFLECFAGDKIPPWVLKISFG